jgi:hypothetical protein
LDTRIRIGKRNWNCRKRASMKATDRGEFATGVLCCIATGLEMVEC